MGCSSSKTKAKARVPFLTKQEYKGEMCKVTKDALDATRELLSKSEFPIVSEKNIH